jgi:hypothetical protein
MSCLNENIGYNQPTNTGYYLGSDLKSDAEAWAEAEKVQNKEIVTGIKNLSPTFSQSDGVVYDLQGRCVKKPQHGLYIKNGKKIMIK